MGLGRAPVDYLKGAVGAQAFSHHPFAPNLLVVGVKVIYFLSVFLAHGHVGCIEQVATAVAMQQVAIAVFHRGENDAVIAPLGEVVNGG